VIWKWQDDWNNDLDGAEKIGGDFCFDVSPFVLMMLF
jgi:hypothetical protein